MSAALQHNVISINKRQPMASTILYRNTNIHIGMPNKFNIITGWPRAATGDENDRANNCNHSLHVHVHELRSNNIAHHQPHCSKTPTVKDATPRAIIIGTLTKNHQSSAQKSSAKDHRLSIANNLAYISWHWNRVDTLSSDGYLDITLAAKCRLRVVRCRFDR